MVITVTVIFAVSFLPHTISYILLSTHIPGYSIHGRVTHAIANTMLMFNSAINPIVYMYPGESTIQGKDQGNDLLHLPTYRQITGTISRGSKLSA